MSLCCTPALLIRRTVVPWFSNFTKGSLGIFGCKAAQNRGGFKHVSNLTVGPVGGCKPMGSNKKMGVNLGISLRTQKLPSWFHNISWVVLSNIFYFHPYLGKWSNLTNIFQMAWNRQPVSFLVRCWISASRWPQVVNRHPISPLPEGHHRLGLVAGSVLFGHADERLLGYWCWWCWWWEICLETAVLSKVLGCRWVFPKIVVPPNHPFW